MLGLLGFLLIGLVLGVALLTLYTAWVLTHPPRRTYASAVAAGRPGEPGDLPGSPAWTTWTLRTGGLELPVWDITGRRPDGPTVVLVHGWGDSRIGGLTRAEHLLDHAARVVLWDLPGHGEAPGWCSQGVREVGCLEELLRQLGRANEPPGRGIVLFGWSLGAGIALAAAASPGVAGVIAESPYRLPQTPARNMLVSWGVPWRANLPPALWLLGTVVGTGPKWRGFDRAALAGAVVCPLLIVQGDADTISPPQDAQAIAEAGRGTVCLIPGAGHYGLWTDRRHQPLAQGAVLRFLASLDPAATTARAAAGS